MFCNTVAPVVVNPEADSNNASTGLTNAPLARSATWAYVNAESIAQANRAEASMKQLLKPAAAGGLPESDVKAQLSHWFDVNKELLQTLLHRRNMGHVSSARAEGQCKNMRHLKANSRTP